jgi:glycosyltransferase involved in cell wall biosynthesis
VTGRNRPRISILTPSWNRAGYLERVWQGLTSQTFKDFEWLIANDGSTDETTATVQSLAARSKFPIVFIDADLHIGKPRMDNALIEHARGEFLLWNDSDDYLTPNALARLVQVWESIPAADASSYIGVTALCADAGGAIQSTATPEGGIFDTTWFDLSEKFHVEGDKLFFVRSEPTKQHRFAEVDFMVTESSMWNALSSMKTRFIPEVLKIMDRGAANRISFSGKMEYCRGKAYGIALSERFELHRRKSLRRRMWIAITYFRYCAHGEVRPVESCRMWDGNLPRPLFMAMYPLGLVLAAKDLIQRKVRRTHRDFLGARDRVKICVAELNG